jgi:hypothetical protein
VPKPIGELYTPQMRFDISEIATTFPDFRGASACRADIGVRAERWPPTLATEPFRRPQC